MKRSGRIKRGLSPFNVEDEAIFSRVNVELGVLTWPNGADLDPEWMHEELGKNKTWSVPD